MPHSAALYGFIRGHSADTECEMAQKLTDGFVKSALVPTGEDWPCPLPMPEEALDRA
jgi:hypothetical protein